ncbi:MAG: MBL fold metallo-hydrolase [bacterium]|nr:MBL fold metallo-hydrolase [bacterium]
MTSPTQITPNVYQITRGANIFLLKTGAGELTIIDAGIPGAAKRVLEAAAALGYSHNQIRHLLLTHGDLDHIGSVAGLAKATGATVYAGTETKTYVEQVKSPDHMPAPIATITNLMLPLMQKKASVQKVIQDGDTLPIGGGIQAIHTPGHTSDNFSFYWPQERVLFAPDLLNTQRGPLGMTPKLITWNMDAAISSARKVLALNPEVICVGHGAAARAPFDLEAIISTGRG